MGLSDVCSDHFGDIQEGSYDEFLKELYHYRDLERYGSEIDALISLTTKLAKEHHVTDDPDTETSENRMMLCMLMRATRVYYDTPPFHYPEKDTEHRKALMDALTDTVLNEMCYTRTKGVVHITPRYRIDEVAPFELSPEDIAKRNTAIEAAQREAFNFLG